jgi:hypothetical protein
MSGDVAFAEHSFTVVYHTILKHYATYCVMILGISPNNIADLWLQIPTVHCCNFIMSRAKLPVTRKYAFPPKSTEI